MFTRYNSRTMSDTDPQLTNDSSPDPSAEKVQQSPAPEKPSAEIPAPEATSTDPTPEDLSAGISAEVDALLADQGAPSIPEAASTPAEENGSTPPVDPTAILDAALGAMNAADNLVELAPGARTTGSVQSINLDRKEAVVEFGPKTVESAASISLSRSPVQVTGSFSFLALPKTPKDCGRYDLRVQPLL